MVRYRHVKFECKQPFSVSIDNGNITRINPTFLDDSGIPAVTVVYEDGSIMDVVNIPYIGWRV